MPCPRPAAMHYRLEDASIPHHRHQCQLHAAPPTLPWTTQTGFGIDDYASRKSPKSCQPRVPSTCPPKLSNTGLTSVQKSLREPGFGHCSTTVGQPQRPQGSPGGQLFGARGEHLLGDVRGTSLSHFRSSGQPRLKCSTGPGGQPDKMLERHVEGAEGGQIWPNLPETIGLCPNIGRYPPRSLQTWSMSPGIGRDRSRHGRVCPRLVEVAHK